MRDIVGNEITVGAFIAYGVRSGNSGGLNIGVVRSMPFINDRHRGEVHTIKVRGAEIWRGDVKLSSRDGTLLWGDRIIVLNDVPEQYKTLFTSI